MIFYGQDDFFSDLYARRIIKIDQENTAVLKLYYDEFDFKTALAHLSSTSLFASKSLLILKSDKKLNLNELKELIATAARYSFARFIYICQSSDFKFQKAAAAAFKPKLDANFVRFFKPTNSEGIAYLLQVSGRFKIHLDATAAGHLLHLHNADLALCVNDLKRLQLNTNIIDIKTINSHLFALGDVDIQDFFVKFLRKENYQEILEQMFSRQFEVIFFISSFASFIQQLLLFKTAAVLQSDFQSHIDERTFLGFSLPPMIKKQQQSLASLYSLKTFRLALTSLLELELRLKSDNKLPKTALLLAALIKIKTKIL